MRLNARWVLGLVGGLLASALGASNAAAYCQTTTSKKQVSSCSPSCVMDGYPLAWPKRDITYVFNEKGFPGLSDSEMRRIFSDAFGAWESADCDGEPVGFKLTASRSTTSLTVGPEMQEPNASVISHLDSAAWADLGLDGRAFALTAIWFEDSTGRILGADMHFNGGMDPFGVCTGDSCNLTDLPNVATHEAGHFLGLAHSQDAESTMWCDAQAMETNKRSLGSDDEEGICAAYPRGVAFTSAYFPDSPGAASTSSSSGGCSASPSGSAPSFAGLSLLAGLTVLLRRRRR